MRGSTISSSFWLLYLAAVVVGCSAISERDYRTGNTSQQLENAFSVSPAVAPPSEIQSIQLYRRGSPSNPPVVQLNNETLVLEFDHLESEAVQFKISVEHFSKDWQPSPINPDFYLDSFYEDYFGAGTTSYVQRPSYRHYEYELPSQQLSFTVSGNYLLSVYSADSNRLLFALPFFVTEEEGTVETSVEKLFAGQENMREQDQLFSRYRYPPFVNLPQFDLSFIYIHNQFWGRARSVRFLDTSAPGTVNFHLSRDEAFPGDYEFKTLDLRSFTAGNQILSYEPENIPPKVILRRDVRNFSTVPAFDPGNRFGVPEDDRNAQYADVHFQLETDLNADSLGQIYLVGDFNGWSVNELNRMHFNPSSQLWEGRALIKQGEYAYKYVVLKNNRIDDLSLDRSFTFRRQQYFTLVYYRDPVRHYDRLLKTEHIQN